MGACVTSASEPGGRGQVEAASGGQVHHEPLAGADGVVCPLLIRLPPRAVAEVSGPGPVMTAATVYQAATNPMPDVLQVISVVASRSLCWVYVSRSHWLHFPDEETQP